MVEGWTKNLLSEMMVNSVTWISTLPSFILPEGNGRGTNCPGVPYGQHLSIEELVSLSDHFPRIA